MWTDTGHRASITKALHGWKQTHEEEDTHDDNKRTGVSALKSRLAAKSISPKKENHYKITTGITILILYLPSRWPQNMKINCYSKKKKWIP